MKLHATYPVANAILPRYNLGSIERWTQSFNKGQDMESLG